MNVIFRIFQFSLFHNSAFIIHDFLPLPANLKQLRVVATVFIGSAITDSRIGGFIGVYSLPDVIINCFWNSDSGNTSGVADSAANPAGLLSLTNTQMCDIAYFNANWDICTLANDTGVNTWVIDQGNAFPMLPISIQSPIHTAKRLSLAPQKIFFLHDRLGSVRQVIDSDANVRCL